MLFKLTILGLFFVQEAFAVSAGALELKAINDILTGNLGLAAGLLITIWGLWKTFVSGETGGGVLILFCGVLLTLFPGVFNVVSSVVQPLAQAMTGG